MNSKNEILDEVSLVLKDKGLNFQFLLQTLFIIFIVLIFVFPKLYLQHEIYYKSRKIAKLQSEYRNLKAQNNIIHARIKKINFTNKTINTIF